MALTHGSTIVSGGTVIAEVQLSAGVGGAITLPNAAIPVDGTTVMAWYRKPSESQWNAVEVDGNNAIIIPGAGQNEAYCVKYFYIDENARQMTLRADYVPAVIRLVLIADVYAGISTDVGNSTSYGKMFIEIPAFQLSGGQELTLAAGSAATTSLSGNALAIEDESSCEGGLVFGTITEQVFGAVWQNDVLAIAPEDGDIELEVGGSETLAMRIIWKGNMAAQRKANSNFTFAVEATPAATATGVTVSADGVITAGDVAGTAVISVNLTGYTDKVEPCYVKVTVA